VAFVLTKQHPRSVRFDWPSACGTQRAIHRETGINEGNLSTLVRRLAVGQTALRGRKQPKLAIPIPMNFFIMGDTIRADGAGEHPDVVHTNFESDGLSLLFTSLPAAASAEAALFASLFSLPLQSWACPPALWGPR